MAAIRTKARDRKRLRYEQVMELVERLIGERALEPGSLLPTNNELADMAGVSLITVRRALDELERAGRVARHQGVGTFVADGRIVADPVRSGDLLATLARGGSPDLATRLLDVVRGRPSPTVARVLQIEVSDDVWLITRLRSVRNRPAILEQAMIPVRLAPRLDHEALAAGHSLYRFLEREYGLRDEAEEQYLAVAAPNESERASLRLPVGEQVVRIRGVSFAADGIPFDSFQQVYPASDFVFYISGRAARQVLKSTDVEDWGIAR